MSETPQSTVTRWLDDGSAVLTTPPEVREAIRAVLESEAYWEKEALRYHQNSDFHQEQRMKAEAERDTLRAEVSKMRTATAQAAIRSARRVFAPTDEIGDARAEAADHAAVARGRLDTIAEVEARAEKAEAALRKLTVDAALQGRTFKGNEELPGAEEFYRAYNAGIKTQFKYARDIALAALLDTALAEQAREEE